MRTVLACIDDGPAAAGVLRTARAWSVALGARLRAVHVDEGRAEVASEAASRAGVPLHVAAGEPAAAVLELARDAADLVVLGTRREVDGAQPAGHIAIAVAQGAGVPVLLVPPEWSTGPDDRIRKVLVPLEGSAVTTMSSGPLLRALAEAGVEFVALHALSPSALPSFADHSVHAEEGLAASFADRWCTEVPAEVRLRIGAGADPVLEAAADERPDAIALSWSQDLSPGRASVVRGTLVGSRRPVLLVPATA